MKKTIQQLLVELEAQKGEQLPPEGKPVYDALMRARDGLDKAQQKVAFLRAETEKAAREVEQARGRTQALAELLYEQYGPPADPPPESEP